MINPATHEKRAIYKRLPIDVDALQFADADTLLLAGPFTETDGQTMNGSLIVVEAASLQAAKAIAAGDPFAKIGLFASVEIRPWLWSINPPPNRAK